MVLVSGAVAAYRESSLRPGMRSVVLDGTRTECAARTAVDPAIVCRSMSAPRGLDRFRGVKCAGWSLPVAQQCAPELRARLGDPIAGVRYEAAWALSRLGDDGIRAGAVALESESPLERSAGVRVLRAASTETQDVRGWLTGAVGDPAAVVSLEALSALDRLEERHREQPVLHGP